MRYIELRNGIICFRNFFILFIHSIFCTIYYTTCWLGIVLGVLNCETCSVCRQKVLNHMYFMICDICCFPVHRNCTLFTRTEYNDHMNAGKPDWTCQKCVESVFPLNHITDDDVFHGCLHEFSCDITLSASEYVQTKIFNPFNLNDDKEYIPCSDIDPDSCCYKHLSLSIQMNSSYYH